MSLLSSIRSVLSFGTDRAEKRHTDMLQFEGHISRNPTRWLSNIVDVGRKYVTFLALNVRINTVWKRITPRYLSLGCLWSRGCRLGVQNACTTRPNFISRNRILTAMRLAAPRYQVLIDKRKYQFSWTIVVWQVTRNRQIFAAVRGNFLVEKNPLPRPAQQFIPWG